jgi:2,5-diamino-6-(ribosylamino)-4(3H)-pyrimidinone 5'-phosphate reductase
MDRPIATLFMLMSVDGKISTGSTDELDVDRDFPKIPGVREGLHQYYEIEQTTDLWSFNTGSGNFCAKSKQAVGSGF